MLNLAISEGGCFIQVTVYVYMWYKNALNTTVHNSSNQDTFVSTMELTVYAYKFYL